MTGNASTVPADQAIARYDQVRFALLVAISVLLACTTCVSYVNMRGDVLAYFFFLKQDLPLVPFMLAILALRLRAKPQAGVLERQWWSTGWAILAAVAVTVAACWVGHYLVFGGYDLTRDEQMANFDAAIYRGGHAVAPIPLPWRPFADGLNQLFIQPVGDHEAWVSNYLPINALTRALFGTVGLVDLAEPAMVGLGLYCLWAIAKRLWPDDPIACVVAPLFYLGSSQILIAGMTAYAMSLHIGLNLLWLLLFLRGGRVGHGGAMFVGLLATGIHQPLFHPLFVLPFLYMLLQQRRWRMLMAYCAAYLAIGAVWAAWPLWTSAHGTLPIPQGAAPVGVGYIDRVLTVVGVHTSTIVLMAMNLIRFATWQHLLLIPLGLLGIVAGWRSDPIVRSLTLGLALPVLIVAFLVPGQGHGWGYRYLHGVIGNACLLATGGFMWLRARGVVVTRLMGWSTLASMAIVLPVHLLMARRLAEPFRVLDQAIAGSHVDIVLIDIAEAPYARDLVINRPDLSNRPIRLLSPFVEPSSMSRLCALGGVGFVDWPRFSGINAMFGASQPSSATPRQIALEHAATSAGCRISR